MNVDPSGKFISGIIAGAVACASSPPCAAAAGLIAISVGQALGESYEQFPDFLNTIIEGVTGVCAAAQTTLEQSVTIGAYYGLGTVNTASVTAQQIFALIGHYTGIAPIQPQLAEELEVASNPVVYSVLSSADYDALDQDHSIPKKKPNQRCSEKLRLQLQDEIDNQWCNQNRSCTDLLLDCTELSKRITWNDLCYAARELMKSRCFPDDVSHDAEIDVVRGVRDRCYDEFFRRCGPN